jgi:hypothetical protein
MSIAYRRFVCGTAALLLLVSGRSSAVRAQTPFLRGQSVQPVYEGWQKNADGSISMVFGYMNRNYQEEPYIPIGPNNFFDPGPQDQGQPTYFDTRRQSFVFEVKLPPDWGKKDLVWTITHNGVTNKAIGSLMPTWAIDEGTWRANRGSGISGRSAAEYLVNQPPVARIIGPTNITAKVGEPVTLTATATDDGKPGPKPKPKRPVRDDMEGGPAPKIILSNPDLPTIGGPRSNAATGTGGPADQNIVNVNTAAETGVGITWRHYRGPGKVTFEPRATPVKPGENVATIVRFSEPGTHVIRAVADDSSFTAGADITVVVEAAAGTTK